jgi:hypothetical protein
VLVLSRQPIDPSVGQEGDACEKVPPTSGIYRTASHVNGVDAPRYVAGAREDYISKALAFYLDAVARRRAKLHARRYPGEVMLTAPARVYAECIGKVAEFTLQPAKRRVAVVPWVYIQRDKDASVSLSPANERPVAGFAVLRRGPPMERGAVYSGVLPSVGDEKAYRMLARVDALSAIGTLAYAVIFEDAPDWEDRPQITPRDKPREQFSLALDAADVYIAHCSFQRTETPSTPRDASEEIQSSEAFPFGGAGGATPGNVGQRRYGDSAPSHARRAAKTA